MSAGSASGGSAGAGSASGGSAGAASADGGSAGAASADGGSAGATSAGAASADGGSAGAASADSGSAGAGSAGAASAGAGSADGGSAGAASADGGSAGAGSADGGSAGAASAGAASAGGARLFFDAIARRYDRVYALSGAASRERMSRVLALLEGRRRVLSLGIGTGRELPMLLDGGHEVEGLDVSPEMIAICNRRARTVPIVCGDFYARLPYGDGAFDAVIALHGTLAHPPSAEALGHLAGEIARVAGFLIAEVPAAEGLTAEGLAAEGVAAAEREDVSIAVTSSGRFTHHDKVARVSIEGIALSAEAWRDALGPLSVEVEPLGRLEYRLVGRSAPAR